MSAPIVIGPGGIGIIDLPETKPQTVVGTDRYDGVCTQPVHDVPPVATRLVMMEGKAKPYPVCGPCAEAAERWAKDTGRVVRVVPLQVIVV